ncbi:hypothetical protein Xkoz_00964 [Xenorhabdus kozodoii]|uniref:Uncharacterized protein n=1 Tax=Xenorhabdus kozodoii TaxID=351676 RepID=A0A2D0LFI1_9GAMM|nr:hypothetical protein Xkoz_00964 [Xenorhabdus kozodoii]
MSFVVIFATFNYIPIQLQIAVCKPMEVLISPRCAGRYKTHLERRLVYTLLAPKITLKMPTEKYRLALFLGYLNFLIKFAFL